VVGEPVRVAVCNCDFCQKRTGSVFQVGAYFAEDQFVEIRGDVKGYNGLEVDGVPAVGGRSGTYYFCPTCGSTVYWDADFGLRGVAVGNFVDPSFPAPTIETWTCLRHYWVPPVPGAAQFEEFPPGV
jgi:hypothetical protein